MRRKSRRHGVWAALKAGWKHVGIVFGVVTSSVSIFNLVVDWFSLSLSPITKPLVQLYVSFVRDPLESILVSVPDWMTPNWPADFLILVVVVWTVIFNSILVYVWTNDEGASEDEEPLNQFDLFTVHASMMGAFFLFLTLILVTPILRHVTVYGFALFVLAPLFEGKPERYQTDEVRFMIKYALGVLASSTILLTLNFYSVSPA